MLTLPIGPIAGLAQVQEPAGTGGSPGGGRGLDLMNTDTDNTIIRQIEFELLALALPSSLGLVILRQTFVRVCPCTKGSI